jgi:hypothetical protein
MSLAMSSSFCDKTFSTAAIDSGRAGSWLLNLVDTLDLRTVVLENLWYHHIYILLYLCQKRYQGSFATQEGVFSHPSQNCLNYPGRWCRSSLPKLY